MFHLIQYHFAIFEVFSVLVVIFTVCVSITSDSVMLTSKVHALGTYYMLSS